MKKLLGDSKTWIILVSDVGGAYTKTTDLDDADPDFHGRFAAINRKSRSTMKTLHAALIGGSSANLSTATQLQSAAHRLCKSDEMKLQGLLDQVWKTRNAMLEKRTMYVWRTEPLYICPARIYTENTKSPFFLPGVYSALDTALKIHSGEHDRVILPESVYMEARKVLLDMLFFPGINKIAP